MFDKPKGRVIITADMSDEKSLGVTVEAAGVKGKSCEGLTSAIEKAIGSTGERHLKPEHKQAQELVERDRVRES